MFDVGVTEVMLIFVILLIVVGPERLPRLARTAGLWIGKARSMVTSVRSEIEQELKLEEVKRSIKKQADEAGFNELTNEVKTFGSDVNSLGKNLESSIDSSTTEVAESIASSGTSKAGFQQSDQQDTSDEALPDSKDDVAISTPIKPESKPRAETAKIRDTDTTVE